MTADGPERFEGVTVVADAAGGYAVSLYLVAKLVPLHDLADGVRRRVRTAGVDGRVDVTFVDVVAA